MRGAFHRWVAGVLPMLIGLGATGCSLTKITDFELPSCESDAECQPVNDALQERGEIPQGCRPWVCEQGRCIDLREQAADREKCDGFDNDCDQRIDESYTREGKAVAALAPRGQRVVPMAEDVSEVSWSSADGLPGALAWTVRASGGGRPREARFAGFGKSSTPMSYRRSNLEEASAPLTSIDLTDGCYFLDRWGDHERGTCDFAEVAVDRVGAFGLAATVSAQRCDAGQLRVGHFSPDGMGEAEEGVVIERGPLRRSNTFVGVDPTPGTRCTGASRPECEVASRLHEALPGPACTSIADCEGDADAAACLGRCRDPAAQCTRDEDCDGALSECGDGLCSETGEWCRNRKDCPGDDNRCERFCAGPDPQEAGEGCTEDGECGDGLVCDRLCRSNTDELQLRYRDLCGVSRVQLAAMEPPDADRKPQALVAWIGDTFSRIDDRLVRRGECGGDEAPVETVGIYLEDGLRVDRFHWVTATNEGLPQSLGTTTAGGRPGIDAVGDVGYVVGFSDGEEGALAVHFVPTARPVPDYNGHSCCQDEAMCMPGDPNTVLCEGPADRSGVETEPLPEPVALGPLQPTTSGGSVDDVVVSATTLDDGRVRVGLAWREADDCLAAEPSGGRSTSEWGAPFRIGFRQLELRLTGGEVLLEESGPPVVLAESSVHLGAPAIQYVDAGFVTDGFEPDEGRPASAAGTGGWWVAWPERDEDGAHRVLATRVAEAGSVVIDGMDGPPIDLTQADGGRASMPHLFLGEGDGARFGYLDRESEEVIAGPLTCASPETDPGEEDAEG